MFCPKCGQQNPDNGKYCRSCGTGLGNVTNALSAAQPTQALVDRKGRPVSLERAISKFFTGIAFLFVACILGFTGAAGGRGWWFWLLIPAFGSIGAAIAQYVQIKNAQKNSGILTPIDTAVRFPENANSALPPQQTEWVSPDSKYRTGDLVPPSVTDNTTRHLEIDSEGKTMTLPKK